MNVLAGWLPGAAQAVAAISVAFNLYGILFMGFSSFAMAASTRVGNALGAGREAAARLAALASAIVAPLIWLVVAALLTWPVSQNWLLGLFTTGTDPLLLEVRRQGGQRGLANCVQGVRMPVPAMLLAMLLAPAVLFALCCAVLPCPSSRLNAIPHYSQPVRAQRMRSLLYLVVLLELFDGAQVGTLRVELLSAVRTHHGV